MAYAYQKVTRVSRTHRNKDNVRTTGKRVASKRNTNVKSKRTATRVR